MADASRQRAELAERRKEIDRVREALAFDAATGDTVAGKKLAALLEEVVYIGHRADDLSAAAREGQARVDRAIEREARAEAVDRAQEALALVPGLRRAGAETAEALRLFLVKFAAVRDLADQIRSLGVGT